MSALAGLKQYLKDIIERLDGTREERAVMAASDLYARIQNRIIQTGKDSDGGKIPGYSQTQAPKYFYYGRSRNSGADNRVRRSDKKTLSYTEFRQLNSLQVDHVDLFFTGEMWRGTGVEITRRAFRETVVSIKGKTPEAEQKIEWNSARYGESILTPSMQEIDNVNRIYGEATIKALRIQ